MITRILRTAITLFLFYLFGFFVSQDWQWVMAHDSCCGGGVDRFMFALLFVSFGIGAWFFDKIKSLDLSE